MFFQSVIMLMPKAWAYPKIGNYNIKLSNLASLFPNPSIARPKFSLSIPITKANYTKRRSYLTQCALLKGDESVIREGFLVHSHHSDWIITGNGNRVGRDSGSKSSHSCRHSKFLQHSNKSYITTPLKWRHCKLTT